MRLRHYDQMSDSYLTAGFIILSGGFMDAYTFVTRGGVFANAQTGNLVRLGGALVDGSPSGTMEFILPLTAYALGVFITEFVHRKMQKSPGMHWRQGIVLTEILIFLVVGFMPRELDMLANSLVSFSCAMQVQAFQKIHRYTYASTMCIGNLRNGTEALCDFFLTKDKKLLRRAIIYYSVILTFTTGAAAGCFMSRIMGLHAIWVCCGLLFISFCLMFIRSKRTR